MKKILSAVLAIVLIMSGCGKKEKNDLSNASGENVFEYDVTYYQTAPPDKNPEMVKFYNDKFNIKINLWDIEATKKSEILGQRIIGGEIPDVFSTDTATWKKYINQGIVAEIPMEMLEKYAPNVLKQYNEQAPGILELSMIDGKLYSLPSFNVNNWRAPVVFRQDWLDKLGMEVPETIDDFEKVIYAMAKNDPDGNGKNDTYGLSITALMPVFGAYGQIPFMTGQGGNIPSSWFWNEKDGKLVCGAVQPEMKEALSRIRKWYEDGVLDPEFVTGENQGGYWALSHAFINGRIGVTGIGMVYHWSPKMYSDTKAGQCIEELQKVNPDAKISLGVPPKGPYGQGTFANPDYGLPGICFGKQLEDEPEKMAKLLQVYDWIYESYQNNNTAYYGIEGTHWEYQEKLALDGKTDKIIVPLGKYADGKVTNSHFMNGFNLFSTIFPDNPVNDSATSRWKEKIQTADYHMANKLLVPLESEPQYRSELEKLVVDTYFAIILGTKPVDYFDEFVEKWENLGGNVLTKEANEWYENK